MGIGFALRVLPPELPVGLCLPPTKTCFRPSGCCKGPEIISGEGVSSPGSCWSPGYIVRVCRPGVAGGCWSRIQAATGVQLCLHTGLLPRGSNDRPTVAHEPFRGMRDGFCASASPIPMPHSQVEGMVSVVAGGICQNLGSPHHRRDRVSHSTGSRTLLDRGLSTDPPTSLCF